MNALVISSRFPWPSYSGDRMRASIWLSALSPYAHVALVAPDGEVPSGTSAFDFYPAARSLASGMRGGLTILRKGLPLQTLLAAPYDWTAAIEAAQRDIGSFDTTIVVLTRADPWVRASLGPGMKILDAVDSLRRNAEERGNAASTLSRWFWRQEERRQARAELDVARVYDRIVGVSGEETSEFGATAVAIENSVPVAPLDLLASRRFDFGFWGRLAYFANADAAKWLIDEIWPAILARNPSVTCVIAGADAPRSIRRAAERRGITLLSPVDDISALARSVRVALIPIRYGSGQSSKVLEAGEAGCAIVASRHALRGLAPLLPHVRIAHDARTFVDTALSLLDAEAGAAAAGALRRVVAANYSRGHVLDQLADVAGVRNVAEAVTA
jgi:hypothetical protein